MGDKLPKLREKLQNPDYRKEIKELAESRKDIRDFTGGCDREGVKIIAEIKRSSPSEGKIKDADPVEVAKGYERAGAYAVSVLTEENYFGGSLEFLKEVRRAVGLPLLRKDFIVHDLEIWEAKAFGADAVLLIAAILDDVQLRDFIDISLGLGLKPLVEIFNERELERTVKLYTDLVGVNNRNLKTLEVDLSVSERLLPLMKEAGVGCAVAESGIKTKADIERLMRVGADAFLVGTSLMKAPDPEKALEELLK